MASNNNKRLMEVLGVGTGGGNLEKLKIKHESSDEPRGYGEFEALFNPNELNYSQAISWEVRETAAHSPAVSGRSHDFNSADTQTLSLQLFFDSYERHSNKVTAANLTALLPTLPFFSTEASDVRKYTEKVVGLGQVDRELHRPPICKLFWGQSLLFTGVLTQIDQKFTMFLPNGTPVRATIDCTFTAYTYDSLARALELHSADVEKTRTVRRGDTLHSIASEEYNDASLWRHIAKANGIINPRKVSPGTRLFIPSIRP